MKRVLVWIVVLLALWGSALHAQDITGTWQGTLQAGKELRTVIKISNGDGGGLKAVLYSIDQGGQALPASAITFQASTVKMSIAGIGATYEGKLSADGNSIAGAFTQGPGRLTLNLTRANGQTAWTIPEPPVPLKPMAADFSHISTTQRTPPHRPTLR